MYENCNKLDKFLSLASCASGMATSKPQHELLALKWVCQNILIIGLLLLLKVTTMCVGISQPGTWLIALRWLSYKVWWSGHQVSGAHSPDKVIHHQSGPSHVSQHFIFIYARMWLIIVLVLIKISLRNLPLCVSVYSHIPVVPHLHEPMNIKGRNIYFYTIHEDDAVSMHAMNA